MCQLNCTQQEWGKKERGWGEKKKPSKPDLTVMGDDYYNSSLANFPFVFGSFPQSLTVTFIQKPEWH